MKHIILTYSIYFFTIFSVCAQSSSVFDACYFDRDGAKPPIKAGKGFHINDIYRQTRSCFTPESVKPDMMTGSGSGVSTSIKLYYTKNEEEYFHLKTTGASGKIGFLNLFSVGGSHLDQYASMNQQSTERLIFIARADFGVYSYETDPVMLGEPKALLESGKNEEFIEMYGTHFISGVRRENSIWVVLTRKSNTSGNASGTQTAGGVGLKTPKSVGINFEVTDESETSQLIRSGSYSISIEVFGPTMDKQALEKGLNNLLSDKKNVQLNGIKGLIVDAAKNLSEVSNSHISQYYYTPFSLFGLKNIYWDQKKENELSLINEAVFKAYTVKKDLDEYLAPDGLSKIMDTLNYYLPGFSDDITRTEKIKKAYNSTLPTLKGYKKQLDTSSRYLESLYLKCADVKCNTTSGCCSNSNLKERYIKLETQIDAEYDKFIKVMEDVGLKYAEELAKPECEKEQIGYLYIINKSTNPYDLYQGDNFIMKLDGSSTSTLKLTPGTYSFKATQRSGYAFYPTVNNRTVEISGACSEFTIKVGFED